MRTVRISIKGIVQGVGFRPFVYREALARGISGEVRNTEAGVEIIAQGENAPLDDFIDAVRRRPPRQSRIEQCTVAEHEGPAYGRFVIAASLAAGGRTVRISPDLALCADCLRELFDPGDRRHLYPYINCTNCGPRFTIIRDIPYDRAQTTMAGFPMCPDCAAEYGDPSDRRFHAQPNACHACGPSIILLDGAGKVLRHGREAAGMRALLDEAAGLLDAGKIVAVKGLGGYHIACRADRPDTVAELRRRKRREEKPFAVMARDQAAAGRLIRLDADGRARLAEYDTPILLAPRQEGHGLADNIAPGAGTFGVMLPATPLQHLLARSIDVPLVMTSANRSDEPIACADGDALARLASICDYFIVGEREIHVRADDSIIRRFRGADVPVRRARGFAPDPVRLTRPVGVPVLAVGAELKNTVCFAFGSDAWLSQHLGDLENLETYRSFVDTIGHFRKLIGFTPRVIAHDLHPRYLSARFALDPPPGNDWVLETLKFPVQHHHAHVASAMAENGLDERVIGVAFDGTGLGDDGELRGGEIMTADYRGFTRRAWLEPLALPGGELAIREPWRIAIACLAEAFGGDYEARLTPALRDINEAKRAVTYAQVRQSAAMPRASSGGRLFDALSALCGVCREARYEGQPAALFEAVCDPSADAGSAPYPFPVEERDGALVIGWREMIAAAVEDLQRGRPASFVSARFHAGLARSIAETAAAVSRETGIVKVALSGGCFVNMILLSSTVAGLEKTGLEPVLHRRVPCTDGGIALGQAVIAAASLEQ